MILEAFGTEAAPLLVSGSLGGLVRGLLVLRKALVAAATARPSNAVLSIDIGTSVIIGALVSLFLNGAVSPLIGPVLDVINVDPGAKVTTSGFVAGLVAITIVGIITDATTKRTELKQASNQ